MENEAKIRILVLDRGFVLLALCPDPMQFGFWIKAKCRVIRRWGTTQGLAELCTGPKEQTVLDAVANETIPVRAILRVLEVEQEPWKTHLKA